MTHAEAKDMTPMQARLAARMYAASMLSQASVMMAFNVTAIEDELRKQAEKIYKGHERFLGYTTDKIIEHVKTYIIK